MKLFPATVRWRVTAAITAVSAVVGVSLSLLVHVQFARTQADQARVLQDERLQILLRDPGLAGREVFGARVDDPGLPAALRDAVRGGARATYLDSQGPDPRVWSAAETDGHVLSIHSPYTAQLQTLTNLDRVLVAGSIAAVLAGTIMGVLLGAALSRRLRRAAAAAATVSAGEQARVRDAIGTRPRDEVADLAHAVDDMADALQRRIEAERRVTADIAHELRTPVTGLVTAAELLPPGRPSELVRQGVTRLRVLVRDILEVARLDTAGEQADLTEIALGEFIARRALGARVRVTRDIRVRTDPRRLERVLTNLLENTAKHGAPPVEIEIDGHRVHVRDHGPGFPDVILREGPARFRTGRVDRGGGHGLGLTIAVAQAGVLGATVDFSNPDGGGAQATIALPDHE